MMNKMTLPDGRVVECFRASIPISLVNDFGKTVKIDTGLWAVMSGGDIVPMCHEQFLAEFGDIVESSGLPREMLYNG